MEWPRWSSEVSDPGNQPLSSPLGAVARLQQCKIVGCGRIGNLDRAPAVFTCRARGGERRPAARAWRRFGWTTASVSLTEGVPCERDRRNLHSHSLQLEARWSGRAGHRRYRIPGTSRSRLPGAVADNLAATVYARSARGGTRSPAARAGRRPGWTTASVSLTQGVHQLSNLRNAHSQPSLALSSAGSSME